MFSHDILKIGTLAARGNSNAIHFNIYNHIVTETLFYDCSMI